MYNSILTKLKTREDAEKLMFEIEVLLSGLYQNKGLGFESLLRSKVRSWVSELLGEEFAKQEKNRENYLKGLREELLNLKPLKLTIAFEPSEDALERFSSFVKRNISQNVILEISYDPHVIGGAVIVFVGNYRDFSFKKEFEKVFEESREEVLKILDAQHSKTELGDKDNERL